MTAAIERGSRVAEELMIAATIPRRRVACRGDAPARQCSQPTPRRPRENGTARTARRGYTDRRDEAPLVHALLGRVAAAVRGGGRAVGAELRRVGRAALAPRRRRADR